MDLSEKLFASVSNWLGRRSPGEAHGVLLEDEMAAVQLLAQASDSGAMILGGGDLGSVTSEVIRLPVRLGIFPDRELNRFLLLHKSLAAGAVLRLGLRYPEGASSDWQKACAIVEAQDSIRQELHGFFPAYLGWSVAGVRSFEAALSGAKLPSEDEAWKAKKSKALIRLPAMTLAPWVELLPARERRKLPVPLLKPASASSRKSEQENGSSSGAEYVDLNDQMQRDNPVSHSFEKLETAEEYRGGFRAADGSDQLEDHARALEELKLDRVTRDGESAASQYSSDLSGSFEQEDGALSAPRSEPHIMLPEWDFKTRQFKKDHCRLYTRWFSERKSGGEWVSALRGRHADSLARWERQISGLVNQRKWADRQLDGTEFSVDAAIRYLADARHGGTADPRLYLREKFARRDYAVLVLLDQSLSTDSWVANRRVLDVETESIGLIGCLMKDLREPVAVAGTWSETRNNCQFVTYKDFDGDWNEFFDSAEGIVPSGYTRLGPAIRHATQRLRQTSAKHKLMILLTDGKPTDYDRYEGRYGIEDIHHAFLEARQAEVTVNALAIESQARYYFPHLFGPGNYSVLSDPSELPGQLFEIFLKTRG